MKIKVKTDYDGCSYITAGKVYDAEILMGRYDNEYDPGYLFDVIDDDGDKISSCELRSIHLNGRDWQVIEE